ncbi:hypothetical protein [Absicoccus porci]|nr:hypothetical protein [Absicoccus porci]
MECTTNFNRIRNNLQTLKLNEMDIHLSECLREGCELPVYQDNG